MGKNKVLQEGVFFYSPPEMDCPETIGKKKEKKPAQDYAPGDFAGQSKIKEL